MEYNNEIEEGRINVPKSLNISNKFFIDHNPKCRHFRQNSLNLNNLKASPNLYQSDFKNKDILNNTVKIDKYKNYLKTEDNNSTTTKTSVHDKLKKVTFSTVEIIRVANYKKYNKLNSIKKIGSEEKTYDEICSIF
jgi:hypothetical protein